MLVGIDLVVKRGSKLLERMNAILNRGHLHITELCKACRLGIKRLYRGTHDVLLYLILEHKDLSLGGKELVECDLLLLHHELLLEGLYHSIAVLFLSGSGKRVVGLEILNFLLQSVQLFLCWHIVLSVRTIFLLSDEVLLLFNNFPEEVVAEVLLKLGI